MDNKECMWYEEEKKMVELASFDDGYAYEVDRAMIGLHRETGQFGFMQASGCSCWGGEGEVAYFNNLDDLETYVMTANTKWYTSTEGGKTLVQIAKDKFREALLNLVEN
jgi:hypothetical protein